MDAVKKYKYITPEVVKEGSIDIYYSETESEKIAEVNGYNKYMNECREKMKELRKIRGTYLFANYFILIFLFIMVFLRDILFVQDKAFYVVYNKKKGSLGEEIGYPLFCEINIDWIRGKKYDSRIKPPSDLKIEREL